MISYAINAILVPTDFSTCANNALKLAVAVAERQQASIHLLHVIQPVYWGGAIEAVHHSAANMQSVKDEAKKKLQLLQEELQANTKQKIQIFTSIATLTFAVNEYIHNNNIDIVIMGTHGASGFKEFFIGSNAYDVIKQASCPVLTVPESFTQQGFTRILFPVRAVLNAEEKYDYIKPIVEKNNAAIHLLGLVFEKEQEFEVNTYVKNLQTKIEIDNHAVSSEIVVTERVAECIIEKNKNNFFDLLVINATLDKKWYKFFTGNYTQQIIHHIKVPVLCIKPTINQNLIDEANQYMVAEANYFTPLNLQPSL